MFSAMKRLYTLLFVKASWVWGGKVVNSVNFWYYSLMLPPERTFHSPSQGVCAKSDSGTSSVAPTCPGEA